jgi:hypothetical protein
MQQGCSCASGIIQSKFRTTPSHRHTLISAERLDPAAMSNAVGVADELTVGYSCAHSLQSFDPETRMSLLLIKHIDALVTIVIGLFLLVYYWREYPRLRKTKNISRNSLPFGLLLILTGIGRVVLTSQLAAEPRPASALQPASPRQTVFPWKRALSSDQRAFAKFPAPINKQTETYLDLGGKAERHTVKCMVPERDISLALTDSPMPPGSETVPIEEQFDHMIGLSTKKGYKLITRVSEEHGETPGCRMVMEKDNGQMRMVMRVAITPKMVYAVFAVSTAQFHDDPVINRFVDSFGLN